MDKTEWVKGQILERMTESFREMYEVVESGCWMWQGGCVHGYGSIWIPSPGPRGIAIYAHRFSFFLKTGRWPEKRKIICHTRNCTSRACVNPDHLYEGTHHSNAQDREAVKEAARAA